MRVQFSSGFVLICSFAERNVKKRSGISDQTAFFLGGGGFLSICETVINIINNFIFLHLPAEYDMG